jgi:hypothetical protein
VTARHAVKLTAAFARNLADIEAFLVEVDAPQTRDEIPNPAPSLMAHRAK